MICYSDACAADIDELIRCYRQVLGESDCLRFSLSEVKFSREDELEFVNRFTNHNQSKLIAAKYNSRIVGVASIEGSKMKKFEHVGELGLMVEKAFWHQGIGTALLSQLIDWAVSNPVLRKITLHVFEENERAFNLYKEFGFQVEGYLRSDHCINGKYFNSYLMFKEV